MPSIPENPIELMELKEDLRRMRCAGLLERSWALKREELVHELVQQERLNIFDGTIRNRPQMWTAELWRDTYNFPSSGAGLSNWMDGYIEGRFMHQVDPKDGYSMGDCRNGRQRRVLEFLVPIVHPDKPTRVMITIGNTIFEALDGEVDWGVVFRDLAQRLAKEVMKPKPTPICPFLFHLYDGQGLLTEDEELDYRTTKEMAGYRITPDPDSRPESDDEGVAPILGASPVQETPAHIPNQRRKTTYRAPAGSPPVWSRGPSSPVPPEPQSPAQPDQRPTLRPGAQPEAMQPEEDPEWIVRPFAAVIASLWPAQLGVEPRQIMQQIRSLPKAREVENLRARIAGLLKKNNELKT